METHTIWYLTRDPHHSEEGVQRAVTLGPFLYHIPGGTIQKQLVCWKGGTVSTAAGAPAQRQRYLIMRCHASACSVRIKQ